MSLLTAYAGGDPPAATRIEDPDQIAAAVATLGLRFERWRADRPLSPAADQEEVIAAYREDVERLMRERGFQSVDVVSLTPDHPEREALRNKFLGEHTHSEDEVRFFVDGRGLFYIHTDDAVYSLLCEQGDLVSVPAGIRHWFDMGPEPDFKCIRLFSRPDGWVAEFTGDPIATRFPLLG